MTVGLREHGAFSLARLSPLERLTAFWIFAGCSPIALRRRIDNRQVVADRRKYSGGRQTALIASGPPEFQSPAIMVLLTQLSEIHPPAD